MRKARWLKAWLYGRNRSLATPGAQGRDPLPLGVLPPESEPLGSFRNFRVS